MSRAKIYHRASLCGPSGVSAICYVRPHAIDLTKASWTVEDERVTCRRCLAVIKARGAGPTDGGQP